MSLVSKMTHNSSVNTKLVIANMPEKENEALVKTIIGQAVGISKRKAPDGEKVYEGLMGSFEGVLSDGSDTEQSGTLYLPEGMMEKFLGPFRVEGAKPMDIAMEVYMTRAKNPQGYSWKLTPLLAEVNADDPIEKIKAKLGNKLKPVAPRQAAARQK